MLAIYDFEDSFTYNIYSEIRSLPEFNETPIKVYSWKDITCESLLQHDWVIFGPGPGHPHEYQMVSRVIKDWFSCHIQNSGGGKIKNQSFMGVCLGHQLLWQAMGASVAHAHKPMHGHTENLSVPKWDVFNEREWEKSLSVQRYNSLVVQSLENQNANAGVKRSAFNIKSLESSQEIILSQFLSSSLNGLSMQFHPESVGTSCPNIFFRALFNMHAYNEHDGNADRRHL